MISLADYAAHDATSLGELVHAGAINPAELADAARRSVEQLNPLLNAVLEVFDDRLGDSASDGLGDGPFRGVPFFMKDLGSGVAGRLQEQGVPAFVGYRTDVDPPLTTNFRASGVNIIGRSAVPPMGWTIDTTSPLHGITRSPWNLQHSPGGSSGGSAALVSAGIAPISLASDGAGSLRIPAAFTGLVGLIGTRGRIPTPVINEYGMHVGREGILSRTVRDTATMLDYMSRHRPGDSFIPIIPPTQPYRSCIEHDPPSLRIGLAVGQWGRRTPCDPEIVAAVRTYAALLVDMDHLIVEINDDDIVNWDHFWTVFSRGSWVGGLNVGDMVEEMGGVPDPDSLSYQLWASHELSKNITAAEVKSHAMANQSFNRSVATLFERIDVLLTPTTAILPPIAGGRYSALRETDGQEWLDDLFDAIPYTPLGNETGIPAISLPVGLSQTGLPIGAQLYAPWANEETLLSLAAATERNMPQWFNTHPPIHVGAANLPTASEFAKPSSPPPRSVRR